MRIDRLCGPEPESNRTTITKDTKKGSQKKDSEIEKEKSSQSSWEKGEER